MRALRAGYQDRRVNVLGQQYHVTGAPMDGSSIDNHNRRVYEETLKVIKLCQLYQDVAATTGRKLSLGESVGAFRAVHFGNTQAEAVALLRDTNYDERRRSDEAAPAGSFIIRPAAQFHPTELTTP